MDDAEPSSVLQASVENSRRRRRSLTPVPLTDLPDLGRLGTGEDNGTGWGGNEPLRDPKRHPFEVYPVKYDASNSSASVYVAVAWGTVCQTNPSINTSFPITAGSLDAFYHLLADEYIWLEADFTAAGNLVTLKLKCGDPTDPANGWTSYPNSYASGSTVLGNYWFHPIARYRAPRTSKSSTNSLPHQPFPDSGEFPVTPSAADPYTIAQLTNTHLVALQVCEYINGVSQQMLWKLTPGPGAVTGTGS